MNSCVWNKFYKILFQFILKRIILSKTLIKTFDIYFKYTFTLLIFNSKVKLKMRKYLFNNKKVFFYFK